MMRSYDTSRWSALFFVSYLSINLYFLMNLMLAVVYDAFTRIEKDKFRRLFLHKRKAAQHAFKLLVTKDRSEEVKFHSLEGLLRHYKDLSCKYIKICNRKCWFCIHFILLQLQQRHT